MKTKIAVAASGVGLVALIAMVAVLSTPGTEPPPLTANECPHDWSPLWTDAVKANVVPFTGGRHDMPEYNDCQRFILGSAAQPKYGAVFAIFISKAWSLDQKLNNGQTVAVALIRAEGRYKRLHIDGAGFYCLLLTGKPGNSAPAAGIAPAGTNANCKPNQWGASKELWLVRRHTMTDGAAFGTDVPGAVRWAFDDRERPKQHGWVHYASVPCPETSGSSVRKALCYVGPKNFQVLPPHAILNRMHQGAGNGLSTSGRYRQIDTWGDFQFLAVAQSGASTLTPVTPVLSGVIHPTADLAARDITKYAEGWQPVAEVAMSGDNYRNKWNFSATNANRYNRIDVCYFKGNASDNCEKLPANMLTKCAAQGYEDPVTTADPTPGRWRSRHISAAGDTTYHCISLKLFADQTLAVPGTVRWKWDVSDEKLWFRCPQGCCLVQG